jgi:hypothetical protein
VAGCHHLYNQELHQWRLRHLETFTEIDWNSVSWRSGKYQQQAEASAALCWLMVACKSWLRAPNPLLPHRYHQAAGIGHGLRILASNTNKGCLHPSPLLIYQHTSGYNPVGYLGHHYGLNACVPLIPIWWTLTSRQWCLEVTRSRAWSHVCTRKWTSPAIEPTGTLILDLPSRTVSNKCFVDKPPRLWYFYCRCNLSEFYNAPWPLPSLMMTPSSLLVPP